MRVFVIVSQVEYEDYPCQSYCEGVVTKRENAMAIANELLDKKIKSWVEEIENVESEEDIEVSRYDNTMAYSLFNTVNDIDYYRIDIYEKEVEE